MLYTRRSCQHTVPATQEPVKLAARDGEDDRSWEKSHKTKSREENRLAQAHTTLLKAKRQEHMGADEYAACCNCKVATNVTNNIKHTSCAQGRKPKGQRQPDVPGLYHASNVKRREDQKLKLRSIATSAGTQVSAHGKQNV